MKVHVGDTALVTRGKDKGKKSTVEKIFISEKKAQLAGINVAKKHQKSKGEKRPGGIVEIIKPIALSNVKVICPKCSQPTRIGFKIEGDGKKYRVCKKCGQVI